jgi:hypothetical protein
MTNNSLTNIVAEEELKEAERIERIKKEKEVYYTTIKLYIDSIN